MSAKNYNSNHYLKIEMGLVGAYYTHCSDVGAFHKWLPRFEYISKLYSGSLMEAENG